jgi:hypothetical protein
MRELVRALALEPTNPDHVAMFANLMSTPPTTIPPEVAEQLAAQQQNVIRSGLRFTVLAIVMTLAFLPLVIALGIRRVEFAVAICVPAALTCAVAFAGSRARSIKRPIQYATLVFLVLTLAGLSRLFGPLILMPAFLAGVAIVMQAHPERQFRVVGLAACVATMIVPLVLELVGILPTSYEFAGGRMSVLPQLHELPRELSIVFLVIASIGIAIVPAVYVARLRADLAAAQQRQLVQTWHFRRLGDDLIRASSR